MTTNLTQQFYDRISHAYDLIADGGEHQARELGLERLGVQPGESVLEIGYGTGHSLVQLANSVDESGRVTGIDISPGMRDVAQKRISEAGVESRVELLVGEVPPLPLQDNSFDVVSMSFTLELFPLDTIPAVLTECRRVLRPGGRLGVVSMATVAEVEDASVLERTYIWMHTHFPHIVDCQPIPLERLITGAGSRWINRNESRCSRCQSRLLWRSDVAPWIHSRWNHGRPRGGRGANVTCDPSCFAESRRDTGFRR